MDSREIILLSFIMGGLFLVVMSGYLYLLNRIKNSYRLDVLPAAEPGEAITDYAQNSSDIYKITVDSPFPAPRHPNLYRISEIDEQGSEITSLYLKRHNTSPRRNRTSHMKVLNTNARYGWA